MTDRSPVTRELLAERRKAMAKIRRLRARGIEIRGSEYAIDVSTPDTLRGMSLKQRKAALEEFKTFNKVRLERSASGKPISSNLLRVMRLQAQKHDKLYFAAAGAMADFRDPGNPHERGRTNREHQQILASRPVRRDDGKIDHKRVHTQRPEIFGEISAANFDSESGARKLLAAIETAKRNVEQPELRDEHFERRWKGVSERSPLGAEINRRLEKFTPKQRKLIISHSNLVGSFAKDYSTRKELASGEFHGTQQDAERELSKSAREAHDILDEAEIYFGIGDKPEPGRHVLNEFGGYAKAADRARKEAAARGKSITKGW